MFLEGKFSVLDSIIYVTREGDEYEVPSGSYLGAMKDEIAKIGPNAVLTEFVSTGSKSYGYRGMKEEEDGTEFCCVKCKGIPFTFRASQLLTFDVMKESILKALNGDKSKIVIPDRGIRRLKDHTVVTRDTTKEFGFTENKRMMPEPGSFIMYPFGF